MRLAIEIILAMSAISGWTFFLIQRRIAKNLLLTIRRMNAEFSEACGIIQKLKKLGKVGDFLFWSMTALCVLAIVMGLKRADNGKT